MKRAASVVLCLALVISLAGCSISELFSGVDKTISEIAEKAAIIKENGIFVSRDINGKEISSIEPVPVGEVGRFANCYAALGEGGQTVYRYLLAAANNMTEGWFYCGKASDNFEKDVAAAYKAVLNDNPQIFWISPNYVITTTSGRLCVAFSLQDGDINNDYLIKGSEKETAEARLQMAVDNIVREAANKPTDYSKELFVHDYLCNNSTYDLEAGEMIYTSYGALVDKICVCEGFSRAMQLVMFRLGINCNLVCGAVDNEGHMWNSVKIGDNWYNTDITWDKNEKYGVLHNYFNITDEEIKKDHTVFSLFPETNSYKDGEGFNLLFNPCVSEEYNFYAVGGRYLTDNNDQTALAIYSEYQSGADFAELMDVSTGDVGERLNSVAYVLRDRLKLTSYTKIRNTVIVFFENTY